MRRCLQKESMFRTPIYRMFTVKYVRRKTDAVMRSVSDSNRWLDNHWRCWFLYFPMACDHLV